MTVFRTLVPLWPARLVWAVAPCRVAAFLVALCLLAVSGAQAGTTDQALVARGAYLARAADCVACHTRPGGAAFAGGYGIQSPMGVIYSSNITPSMTQGIGGWSEAAFARAVREGVSAKGTRLYPAMPYDSYAGMTDADVHALYVYIQSAVAPIDIPVGSVTSLRFPYSMRSLMRVWNWLYLDHTRFSPRTDETPEQARGRYLVDSVAHCGTCHTPRNALMAAKSGHKLEGAPVGGWYAPDIAAGSEGPLASWHDDEIRAYLRDGHARNRGVAAGPMGEAVEHSLRYLTEPDLNAIIAYLRQQKRVAPSPPDTPVVQETSRVYEVDSPRDRQTRDLARQERDAAPGPFADRRNYRDIEGGAALYMAACASCHQIDGRGTADDYYPSLRHSRAVRSSRPDNLVMTILAGVHRDGADGPARMPAFRHELTDTQIAMLVRFVTAAFADNPLASDSAAIAALRRFDRADFPAVARPSASLPEASLPVAGTGTTAPP